MCANPRAVELGGLQARQQSVKDRDRGRKVHALSISMPNAHRESCSFCEFLSFGSLTSDSRNAFRPSTHREIGLRFVELADRIEDALGVRTEVVSRRAIKPRYWKILQEEWVDVP